MDEINIEIPLAVNETVRNYVPGSPECISLKSRLVEMENESFDIPIIIGISNDAFSISASLDFKLIHSGDPGT